MGLFDDVLGDDAPSQSSGLFDDVLSPKPDSAGVAEFKRRGSDALVSLGKGAIAVPEALVGLADIPTGGAIGKLAEEHGFKPKEWKANIDSKYSPEQQKANQAVRSADGFLPTLSAAVQNPSTIINSVIESAPSTVAGGAIGRLATAGRAAPVIAGSIGEGALSAGSTAEQVRQESPDGLITPQQAAIAAGSGALTGLITVAGGKASQKLGIHDVDTIMAGGGIQQAATKGLARRVGEGAASEGVEELLQSGQEQAAQNLAQNKPIMEGVGNAAATGMLAGHVMGGAANVPGPLTAAASLATPEDPTKTMPYKTTEAAQARADAMTTQYGVPFEVTPHPTVGGSFAVTPLEVDDESGTTGKPAAAKAGMGADVPAGDIGAPAVAAGAGSGDATGTGAVGEGQAAAAAADMDRPAAGADGAGPEVGTPAVARGPLEAAAQLAPAAQAPATITPLASAAPVDTATLPPTNIGAAKVDPDNPRLLTEHDIAAHQAASSSLNDSKETPSMIDANNRKLGRSQWNGMKLAWENGNGTVREGVDEDGTPWKTLMPHNYGFIENTEAADSTPDKKAGLDISMGPNPDSNLVVIVNQTKKDGSFDEHKIQAGFNTPEEARQAYLDSYQAGWNGGNDMRVTTVEGLQKWKDNGDTKAPFEDGPALATVQSSPPAAGAAPTSGSSTAPAPTESQPGSASGPLPAQPTTGFAAQGSAALHSPAVQNPSPAAGQAGLLSDVGASDGSLRSPDKETDANLTSDLGVNTTKSSANSVEKLQNQANSLRQIISNVKEGTTQRAAMEAKLGELTSQITALTPTPPSPAVQAAVTDGVIPDAPATAPGLFMSRVQAAKYAVDHGLAADPVDTDSGVVLQPRSQRASPQQAKIATTKVAQLNKGLVRDGYQPVTPVLDASSPDMAIAQSVAKVAFGVDVTPVKGSTDFDGVREGNNVFVSTDSVNPVLAVTGHEVYHFYQDSPVGKAIRAIAREHLRPGQIPLRQDLEDAAQRQSLGENAPGFVPTSADYAEHELVADLHGAMWMDSKFWSAMAQKDESLFRKVAYKFMEYATKAVSVARASSFNADNIVRDVDAVREAIATAWAQHHKGAYNGGKGAKNEGTKGNAGPVRQASRSQQADAGSVRDAGGLRGSNRVLEQPAGQGDRAAPLKGLPNAVRVDGQQVSFGPHQPARDAADSYRKKAGITAKPVTEYVKVDKARSTRIANAFEAMEHNPSDPKVKASYDAMIKETLAQYQAIKATGLKVEFIRGDDPYGNPRNAIRDVVDNNHLWVFPTESGFGGSASANVDVSGNPLLAPTGETISGQTALANDIFRIVHDYFGHIKEGVGFRAEGEENAWRQHASMYSAAALPAMTSETRGQNSWVNFGPYAESNKTASGADTQYAPQKIGLMPEWTYNEGRGQHGKNESNQEGRDRGHRAGNLAGVRREAAVAIKPKKGDARTVVGIHYGKVGDLGTLDGSKNGTGIPGSEQKRLKYSEDARIKRRVYFYPDTGTDALPAKEGGLGTHAYAVKLGNLYDFTKDPAGIMAETKDIRDQADRANTLESMVVDAGYDGYGNSHMIVVLDGNVPVTYLGDQKVQFSRKPIFYSALQRAISDSIPRDKAGMVGIGQAKMWIAAKAKEGLFKPAEVEWSGINDYLDLQTGKVPVAELAAFVENNGVKVEDVMKGEHDTADDTFHTVEEAMGYLTDDRDMSEADIRDQYGYLYDDDYIALANADIRPPDNAAHGETEYEKYVLPGGKNYRELLLTLPDIGTGSNVSSNAGSKWEYVLPTGERKVAFNEADARKKAEESGGFARQKPVEFKSSHWDEPNILAHIRFNDRTDADGKKVLFIEELQSDWGQEGKKKGFFKEPDPETIKALHAKVNEADAAHDAVMSLARKAKSDAEYWAGKIRDMRSKNTEEDVSHAIEKMTEASVRSQRLNSEARASSDAFIEATRQLNMAKTPSGPPRGPFVEKTESWLALGIKRMIRYAAENGYDKVAFVNGEQSAERYDLSKQVSEIAYNKKNEWLRISGMDDNVIYNKRTNLKELEDTVGKEMAKKIEEHGDNFVHLTGLDLKIGGEGMKAFYDKIVPNVANDVLKKLGGGKVAPTIIPIDGFKGYVDYEVGPGTIRGTAVIGVKANGERVVLDQNGDSAAKVAKLKADLAGSTQLGFTVTDAMKDAALQGQPQFSRKPPDWLATVPGMTPDIAEKVGLWTPPQTIRQRIDTLKTDFGKKVVQGVFDQFAPIKELDFKSYILARMAKSTDGGLEGVLLYGKVKLDSDGALTNDLSGGFIDMMKALKGEQDRFFAWVAGNRAAQLKAEGRENLFTDTDISALRRANQGTLADGSSRPMLYANSLRELNAFSTSILDIAEQAGTIDGAERATWEKDFYVPFYRVLDDDKVTGPRNLSGLTNQYAFKKLKGGTEGLNDLMQNTIMNWSHLLSSAMKNQAASSALKAAELVHAAHVIPDAQKGSLFVLDHGKKVHYFVDDPFLLDAVGSLSYSGMKGWGIDLATKAKRALSYGVTFSPSYRARNLIRDQLQAIAANPMSYNIASNLVKGFKYSAKNNPMYAQMITGGALIRMGSAYEDNRAGYLKKLIGGIDEGSILNSPEKIKTLFNKAVHAWQEVGDRAESVTRASIYEKALRDNKSHLEASYLARDSMDFGLQGSWPAVRLLTQTVPFMNARLQGIYKLGRAWNGDKKRFIAVTGAVTMATIAMMLANRDDDDWKRREEWDRDNFWWFKAGDTAYRIPKPFEIGAMASIAERGLDMVMDGMDEKSAKRFGKRLWNIVLDNLAMNPLPQLVKPAVDLYANTDSFTGRKIESLGMERLSKENRIGANTTATAQLLGKAGVLSPVQIDQAIQGYFGWLGTHAAMAADAVVRPALGLPDKPSRRLDDTFVIGDWVKQLPSNQSRFVEDFYKQAQDVREAVADLNNLKKMGNVDAAKAFVADNRDTLKKAPTFNLAEKQIGNINLRLRQIAASEKMLPEAKRAEIDRLSAIKLKLAERVTAK